MKLKNILIDQMQGDIESFAQYHNDNRAYWYIVLYVSELRQKYVTKVVTTRINRNKNAKSHMINISDNNAKNIALHRLRTFLLRNNVHYRVSDIPKHHISSYLKPQFDIVQSNWISKAIVI